MYIQDLADARQRAFTDVARTANTVERAPAFVGAELVAVAVGGALRSICVAAPLDIRNSQFATAANTLAQISTVSQSAFPARSEREIMMAGANKLVPKIALMDVAIGNAGGPAFQALSGQQPLLGTSEGPATYIGRIVVELWESPDPGTDGDGLRYALFPASAAGGATKQLSAAFVKEIATKLARRAG